MGNPIRTVLIVGGGIAAWMTASALVRRLPGAKVTVIDDPSAPLPLSECYGGTVPSIHPFLDGLRIDDRNLLACTGGVFRLGQSVEQWTQTDPNYIRTFGPHGVRIGSAPFHQVWLRALGEGNDAQPGAFSDYSAASTLARAGRFMFPTDDVDSPLGRFEVAFNLDPLLYRDYMRAYALHAGVERVEVGLAEPLLERPDRLSGLRTRDGSLHEADLYIDCTGKEAALLATLEGGDKIEDWSEWLHCNRALFAEGKPSANPPAYDRAVAMDAGWRLETHLRQRAIHGMFYSSDHLSDEAAAAELTKATGSCPSAPATTFSQGRRKHFWIGNCVAIGESAIMLEPLEATYLQSMTTQIAYLLAYMADTDFAPVELEEYNRKVIQDSEGLRDFLILHYALSDRSEPFWRGARSVQRPPRLDRMIELFKVRGKVAAFDGVNLEFDAWLSVFLGQGARPRCHDPLADSVPIEQFKGVSVRLRSMIDSAVHRAPTHRRFLEHFLSSGPQ